MTLPRIETVRDLCSQGRWNAAVGILVEADAAVVADFMMTLPFEEQRALFRAMPVAFAASLTGCFTYFHAYVLLHSRPAQEMQLIVNAMNPADRDLFLDALPEEAWQSLMNELEATRVAGAEAAIPTAEPAEGRVAIVRPVAPKHIIEARQIEKFYQQPEGREIQVIAPMDLSIEAGQHCCVAWSIGSGKSTLLRILSGLMTPSGGEVLWHGKPMAGCRPNVAIVFQSFALSLAHRAGKRGNAASGAGHGAFGAAPAGPSGAWRSGAEGFRDGLSQGIFGRHEAARGVCAGAGAGAGDFVYGRAFSALDVLTAENLRGELMELWLGKKIPTRAFFWSPTISRKPRCWPTALSCWGETRRNPRGLSDSPEAAPRPQVAEFLLYVDYIYKVMTQPELELAPPSARPVESRGRRCCPTRGRAAWRVCSNC